MAIAIQRITVEEALQNSHEALELKVHERTRDLAESNKSLRHEIKKHKKTEASLAESEAMYRGLIEDSLVGVLTTTQDGYITFANDAMIKIFDFDNAQRNAWSQI